MQSVKTFESRMVRVQDQFRQSCDQIILLNQTLKHLSFRYKNAKTERAQIVPVFILTKTGYCGSVHNKYYMTTQSRWPRKSRIFEKYSWTSVEDIESCERNMEMLEINK